MGAGNSKTTASGETHETTPVAAADDIHTSAKRQHDSGSVSPQFNKRLKRSESDEVVPYPSTHNAPIHSSLVHRPKEHPNSASISEPANAPEGGEKRETVTQFHSINSELDPVCQNEGPQKAPTSPGDSPQPQQESEQPSSESSKANDNGSPLQCSQQMSEPLEAASQAVLQAAAASQGLEDVFSTCWRSASESKVTLAKRERNRKLLKDAIEAIQKIKDSDLFSPENLGRPSTPNQSFKRRLKIKQSRRSEVDDDVDFVAEAAHQPPSLHNHVSLHRQNTQRRSAARILLSGKDDPRKLKDNNENRGLPRRMNGRQRKLTGFWKEGASSQMMSVR